MDQFKRILMTRNDPTFIFQLNVTFSFLSFFFVSWRVANDRTIHYVCTLNIIERSLKKKEKNENRKCPHFVNE